MPLKHGSLLSIKKNTKGIVIPSEETRITMYPKDYEEFRWAMGDTVTVPLLGEALRNRQPLGEAVCRKLMRDFRLYMLVGGMPQAVNTYLDTINTDYSQYKMYVGDTGLFVTLAFWDKSITENIIYQKLLSDKLSANLGYVYENIVTQMLTATGNKLFYHTWPSETSNHNYEVDFILSHGAKIWPIEVRSFGYKSHKSLDEFCKKYSSRISDRYLIYTKDLRRDEQTLLIPACMTMHL